MTRGEVRTLAALIVAPAAGRGADRLRAWVTDAPVTALLSRMGTAGLSSWLVSGFTCAWVGVFGWLAATRHESFRSHRFDLGNMVQAVWSTAHGRPLEITTATGEQMSRLGVHVDPILVLFAPLWWLVPTPLLLVVVQAVALGLGALPVFWLARRHLKSDVAAALLALAYLLYLPIGWNAVNDFHPVTLAIPLLLLGVWFLDQDRLRGFALVGGLALMTNELIGLGVGALGLWYALARRRRRAGFAIALVGPAWTAVCLKLIVPAFSHGHSSVFYSRFSAVGGSPAGVVRTLFTDPEAIVSQVFTAREFAYVFYLALPLLFLFVWSPALAAVALPQFAVNALASWDSATLFEYQYVSGLVPYLVAATVLGLRRMPVPRRPYGALAVLAATSTFFVVLHPRPGLEPFVYANAHSSAHVDAIRHAIALIPVGARVSATNEIGGHLSDRRYVYSFPVRDNADWVIVDEYDAWLAKAGEQSAPPLMANELRELRRDRRFSQVFASDHVVVLRRDRA